MSPQCHRKLVQRKKKEVSHKTDPLPNGKILEWSTMKRGICRHEMWPKRWNYPQTE